MVNVRQVRFGRFPHRNQILGRQDTVEEQEYLAGDAPSFWQYVEIRQAAKESCYGGAPA